VKLAVCYMDSASQHEVVRLLATRRIEDARTWAGRSAVEVTALLLESDAIRIAPAPGPVGEIIGPFAQMATGLREVGLVRTAPASSAARDRTTQRALEAVQAWALDNPTQLKARLDELKEDRQEFQPWLESGVELFWEEHAAQHGGLYALISRKNALELREERRELARILERTQDLSELPGLASEREDLGSDGAIATDAYIVAALLRGRYHDEVAARSGDVAPEQRTHHPIRRSLSLATAAEQARELALVTTTRRLAGVVLASAFLETGIDDRVKAWLRNVDRVKRTLRAGEEPIARHSVGGKSVDAALKIAETAGVHVRSARFKRRLDTAVAVGLGGLTTFVLAPWTGPAALVAGTGVAAITDRAVRKANVSERVGKGFQRKARLRNLERQGSGLLEAKWVDPEG